MLKDINLKKLTSNTLIGILLSTGLVVESSDNSAVASSCSNNGHGNNAAKTYYLSTGDLTIGHYDPSNPNNGKGNGGDKQDDIIADLVAGNTTSNGDYYIEYIDYDSSDGTSYSLTSAEATSLVLSHPDWEKPNSSNCDQDGDGINDTTEAGGDVNNPVDSDGDGIPDFADTDSDDDGVSDSAEGTGDSDSDGVANYLDDTDNSSGSVVTGILTADNHYALFTGNDNGSDLDFIGRNEYGPSGNPGTYNWSQAETWNFVLDDDDYIYVVVWDDGNVDESWIGEFNLTTGETLLTVEDDWEYIIASGSNPGDNGEVPSNYRLEDEISNANWQNVNRRGDNGMSPWGTIAGISGDADFLNTTTPSNGKYTIFRTKFAVKPELTQPVVTVPDNEVSLELVLSVDVSTSINESEFELQRNGYIAAFQDASVQQAIKDLPKGIAVTMQFWANHNVVDIGWFKLIADGNGGITNLDSFIAKMQGVKRTGNYTISGISKKKRVQVDSSSNAVYMGGGTDLKLAIESATNLIQNNYYIGDRLVIDISGDGIPDDTPYPGATATWEYGYKVDECGYTLDCPPVEIARDAAVAAGITINGLPINNSSAGSKTVTDAYGNTVTISKYGDQIDDYYQSQVVGGTDAFVQIASGFGDFATAAQKKILKEISEDPTCSAANGCEPENDPPVATDNSYVVYVNSGVTTLDVMGDDTDSDNDTLTITGYETDISDTELAFNNNQFEYTAPSTAGTYIFMYEISDGNGGVDKAEVEIEVKYFED